MKRIFFRLSLVTLSLFQINLSKAVDVVQGEDLYPKVQAILNNTQHGCMRCHGQGARIQLPATEEGYFTVGSKWVSEDRDPAKSTIFTKLRGNPGGIMPPSNPPGFSELSVDERAVIAQWIKLGPVFNEEAVCQQRAIDMISLINDLGGDLLRKGASLKLSLVQNLNSELDFDINYQNSQGDILAKDQIKMKLLDAALSPTKSQKRCILGTFQRAI